MIISNKRLLGSSDKTEVREKLNIPTRKPDELSRKARIHSNILSLTKKNKVDVISKPDKLANRWNRDSKELSSKPKTREAHVNPKQQHSESLTNKPGPFKHKCFPDVKQVFPSQPSNNYSKDMTKQKVVMEQKRFILNSYTQTSNNNNNTNRIHTDARQVDDKSIYYSPKLHLKFESRIPKESSIKVPQTLIPVVNQHTSTISNVAFGPNVTSILSKQYQCQQVKSFTWVKHRIPSPPPNLEQVERKLYPHRFKLIVEDVSTFIRIPTPPPHMPEAINRPLLELIPHPPPDIPKYVSTGVSPKTIALKTNRIPNPILSIIPTPPPDMPSETPPQAIPKAQHVQTPFSSAIPSPPPDLPRETSTIPTPPPDLPKEVPTPSLSTQKVSAIPTPPPVLPKGISIPSPPADLHREIFIPPSLLTQISTIPSPPPDLPNGKPIPYPPPPLPNEFDIIADKFLDRFDSSGSWDSFVDDSPILEDPSRLSAEKFRNLHLQEIVLAANQRENERISKSRKAAKKVNPADFRNLHLQEIVQASNLRENEIISKSRKAAKKVNPADIRNLHLQEIVLAANQRENERISKSRKAAKKVNPADFRNLHLQEIVQASNLRENERISKSRKAAKKVNPADIRNLHLQEIVQAANLRENERISKSRKAAKKVNPADFRNLHLQEIVQGANLKRITSNNIQVDNLDFHQSHLQEIRKVAREKQKERLEEEERISRLETIMKVSNPNVTDNGFHDLHLQEIVKAANLRKDELLKKKRIVSQIKQTQGILPNTSTNRLCIPLPSLKKKPYFTDLIKQLGLFHFRDDYFLNEESSKFTVDYKLSLLIEVENNLVMGKPIRGILPQSLREIYSSSYPDLKSHFNLMSRHLTPPIYHRLSQVKTASGFTIDQAIQTGVDNPGDPFNLTIGCVAGDEDSYSTFAELFDKVIYSANNGYAIERVHCSDFDPITITDGYFDPNYVLSCQVMAARSIKGFSLLPHCTTDERRTVEGIVKECVANMPHPYKGCYYSLSSITPEDHGYLSSRNFLFCKPVSPLVVSARMVRGWPDARGVWLNRNENFMAWVNAEDHVKLISMEEGGDFRNVFERFCLGIQIFEMTVTLRGYELMKSEHLGYIVTCPSNLGTAITLTVTMMTPKLLSYHGLETILEFLHLGKKKVVNAENGEFQVSNLLKIGHTEVEIAQRFINAIHILIRIEKTLWSGLSLQELLQQVNPDLANLLLVGVYPKELSKRIKIPKSIPHPPPDIPHGLPRVWW